MKRMKFASVAAAFILAGVAALGSGCAANSGKLSDPQDDVKLSSYEITALRGYTPSSVDRFGVVLAADTERFALYSTQTGRLFTEEQPFTKLADGLYAVDRGEVTAFYGGAGEIAAVNDKTTYSGSNPVYVSDGRMIYVDAGGAGYCTESSLDPVLVDPDPSFPLKDCYMQEEASGIYSVFDKKGKFLRTVSLSQAFGGIDIGGTALWCLKNKIYTQYYVPVAEGEKDFDFYLPLDGVVKAKLITKSYDVRSGKISEYNDVNYIVGGNAVYPPYADNYVFLSCMPIVDKQLTESGSSDGVLQCFNENVQLHTDVQSLLPEAGDALYDGDYLVLSGGSSASAPMALFRKGKALSVVYGGRYIGSGIVEKNGNYYAAEGELLLSAADERQFYAAGRTVSGDNLLYYTTEENGVTTICVYSLDKEEVLSSETLFEGDPVGTSGLSRYYVVENAGGGYTLRNEYFNFAIFTIPDYTGSLELVRCRTETGYIQITSVFSEGAQKNYLFRANNLPRSYSASLL